MKLKALARHLLTKPNQEEEVQYIVCTPDGKIITMELDAKAVDMAAVLKAFSRKPKK